MSDYRPTSDDAVLTEAEFLRMAGGAPVRRPIAWINAARHRPKCNFPLVA
jgi:hypothetical protein